MVGAVVFGIMVFRVIQEGRGDRYGAIGALAGL